ncbi:hypothetical protein B0H13DRAFT_2369188 [Mycena leptocephala]|nr:hypothetical protein B0H13DRAFT_2369188 [Mycena leptocephala]
MAVGRSPDGARDAGGAGTEIRVSANLAEMTSANLGQPQPTSANFPSTNPVEPPRPTSANLSQPRSRSAEGPSKCSAGLQDKDFNLFISELTHLLYGMEPFAEPYLTSLHATQTDLNALEADMAKGVTVGTLLQPVPAAKQQLINTALQAFETTGGEQDKIYCDSQSFLTFDPKGLPRVTGKIISEKLAVNTALLSQQAWWDLLVSQMHLQQDTLFSWAPNVKITILDPEEVKSARLVEAELARRQEINAKLEKEHQAAKAAADEFQKQEQARKDDWEAAETLMLENEAQKKQAADDAEAERVRKRQAKLEETNAAKTRKLQEARDKYEKDLKIQEKQNAEWEKIKKTYDDILAEDDVDVAKLLEQAAEMESDEFPHPMALNPPAASTVINVVESDDEHDGIEIISGPKKSVDSKWQRLVHQFTVLTSSLNEEQANVLGQNLEHVVNTAISTKCLAFPSSSEEDAELVVNPPKRVQVSQGKGKGKARALKGRQAQKMKQSEDEEREVESEDEEEDGNAQDAKGGGTSQHSKASARPHPVRIHPITGGKTFFLKDGETVVVRRNKTNDAPHRSSSAIQAYMSDDDLLTEREDDSIAPVDVPMHSSPGNVHAQDTDIDTSTIPSVTTLGDQGDLDEQPMDVSDVSDDDSKRVKQDGALGLADALGSAFQRNDVAGSLQPGPLRGGDIQGKPKGIVKAMRGKQDKGAAVQQLEHGLEGPAQVRPDKLTHVRRQLDIHAKGRVLEDLRLERGAQEDCKRAEHPRYLAHPVPKVLRGAEPEERIRGLLEVLLVQKRERRLGRRIKCGVGFEDTSRALEHPPRRVVPHDLQELLKARIVWREIVARLVGGDLMSPVELDLSVAAVEDLRPGGSIDNELYKELEAREPEV